MIALPVIHRMVSTYSRLWNVNWFSLVGILQRHLHPLNNWLHIFSVRSSCELWRSSPCSWNNVLVVTFCWHQLFGNTSRSARNLRLAFRPPESLDESTHQVGGYNSLVFVVSRHLTGLQMPQHNPDRASHISSWLLYPNTSGNVLKWSRVSNRPWWRSHTYWLLVATAFLLKAADED